LGIVHAVNELVGRLLALVTSACWAHNSVVYGLAGRRVGSGAVTHIRLWIALPVMAIVHSVALGSPVPLSIAPGSWGYLAVSGFLGFFLADIFIFRAFVDLGHRETLVILTLSPLVAAIISRFVLGESLSPLQIFAMLVTIGGVAWVVTAEGRPEPGAKGRTVGVVSAVLGAVAQAVGMVLAKRGMEVGAVPPLSANFIRLAAGLFGVTLFRLVVGQFVRDFTAMRDRKSLALIAQGALVGPVLGIIANLYALSLASVGVVTTIMQTSPILLLPVDRFVFRRRLPAGAYFGTIVAVVGAVLLFL
jgi:drug/metabolite transporter (DMT)-like permease